uniref:Uncharacterized protein n=1 Tax=Mola mola TaxID=94237 RepID=A0A3Q3XG16_MOLML
WGDDSAAIEQQLVSHQKFHNSIQRSAEFDRSREELKLSFGRTQQLQDLQQIIQEMCKEIMWVNDREEEELVFDWGDKNINQYIPQKQESYSQRLMSALEVKEKELNKLKAKVDTHLKSNHPASDKIEAYRDTLQTQWSWLLQITKCIDVHLKENAAYNQFFKEANETYSNLQREHEKVRKQFTCDKNTSLDDLLELLKGLDKEKEKIMENKRQVQHLVANCKNIVRLKPRNPEEKSSSPVMVKALCDFKQDQKVICKGDEAILKNNSQRSKWDITGPGGLDMTVPSVCLIIPPPNPLSVSLANKNDQYYEAILSIWNQLYINVKSLIAWQYCLRDIRYINSLTISMISKMRPEEYRHIIKNLENHFAEFKSSCKGSEMFVEEDKEIIENQFNGAQAHYDQLVVELPTYSQYYTKYTLSIYCNKYKPKSVARAEDIVKVHEAILTEKETTSLSLNEVENYILTLTNIKTELDQRKDVLTSMESELAKVSHWNGQVGGPFHRCDMILSKYTEHVGLLGDRWRRIDGQIDNRYGDLQSYHPQLQHYNHTLLSTHFLKMLKDYFTGVFRYIFIIFVIKVLNSEIKLKREMVESVLKDNAACMNTIKDYETDLTVYASGLETLLNIPIKRTMLKSPSMELHQEAIEVQTCYMELLTMSGDYYRYLGELLKNMEELKIRDTKIDLLEEELRLLKENFQDSNTKNKSLEDDLARYKLELFQSRDQLLSMEEVKQSTVLQCNATKESLDNTQSQLVDLNDQVTRLNYLLEEEKRKKRLAEERYLQQQEEYDSVLRKRQNELETVSWSKMEVEKSLESKEYEIEQLRRQLAENAERIKELQKEMLKVRSKSMLQSLQSQHNEIVSERDTLMMKLQLSEKDKERFHRLEDEFSHIKLSLESELCSKQRLTEENERVNRDLDYWKDQYDSKQGLIRQYETDKERLERENNSLKSEIERLMVELRELGETYKSRLAAIQKELQEERCNTESHTGLKLLPVSEKVDPLKLLFEGVRKTVTAQQLLDCGVLDKLTFDQLVKGEKTVPKVSVDKKVFLKGTGSIAGVAAGHLGKMSFTEAKKQKVMSSDSADMLLDAQAATGHIIDPRTNKKLTVKEACATGVVDIEDESKLLAAEAAAIGYKDPITAKLLSAGQAMKMGLINKDTALRILQAQQSAGGILDPVLSVFLPKDIAMDRGLINEDLYQELNQHPECYLDPDTQQPITYISLKTKCKVDRSTGLLLLPEPQNITVDGLRGKVSVIDLVDANLLEYSDIDELREGRLTSYEIESRLSLYLRGSTCIAGVYDEANDKIVPLYQAMKDGLLQPDMTLKLLEAQAASGFIVDPVNNLYLTVGDAYNKKLFGPEFKENLLAAERAVTGYKLPGTDKTISLFQAIERGLTDKDHGSRLLEAQIASGGIIDPKHGHRIGMNVAYKRGYLNEKMNNIVTDQGVASKSYFDPNTEENLTYMELKERCITDEKNGLLLLPIMDEKKKESTMENTLRRRRVVIVDPETNKEMTVREAYDKGYIDYDTFMELSEQECEWEEVTITEPDGSTRFIINDRTTGKQYDITELLEKQVINQSDLDQYRSRTINITQFAGIITNKTNHRSLPASGVTSVTPLITSVRSSGTSSIMSSSTLGTVSDMSVPLSLTSSSSSFLSIPLSPTLTTMTTTKNNTVSEQNSTISTVSQDSTEYHRNISRVSITLASPAEILVEQEPVGAIFDTETLEKISITEALNRGLVDSITAQRLLEAQACTGGIINPINGQRLSIQEAARLGVINEVMASRLKPSQKAYFGFEDVKTRKKMSTAEAMKEMWLPYEAGQRFMEFQYVTGGLYDPQIGCRRSIQDALEMGWLDENTAHKLQDINHHVKNLTCPKTKLKISYKEALDSCMVEERTGVKMLQASSVSSKGISSPYNVSGPGSTTGSRSGSRRSSRRGSVDLSSPRSSSASSLSPSSFITFCSTATK